MLAALASLAMGHLSHPSTPRLASLQLLRQVLLLEHTALQVAPQPLWRLLWGCGGCSGEGGGGTALAALVVAVIGAYAEVRQLPALLSALLESLLDGTEGGGVQVVGNPAVLQALAQHGMMSGMWQSLMCCVQCDPTTS